METRDPDEVPRSVSGADYPRLLACRRLRTSTSGGGARHVEEGGGGEIYRDATVTLRDEAVQTIPNLQAAVQVDGAHHRNHHRSFALAQFEKHRPNHDNLETTSS